MYYVPYQNSCCKFIFYITKFDIGSIIVEETHFYFIRPPSFSAEERSL